MTCILFKIILHAFLMGLNGNIWFESGIGYLIFRWTSFVVAVAVGLFVSPELRFTLLEKAVDKDETFSVNNYSLWKLDFMGKYFLLLMLNLNYRYCYSMLLIVELIWSALCSPLLWVRLNCMARDREICIDRSWVN